MAGTIKKFACHNDLMDVAGDRYAETLRKFAKLVDESS